MRMAIPYRTAKFKSANNIMLSIAILSSTAKFNFRQYFRLYGIMQDLVHVFSYRYINFPISRPLAYFQHVTFKMCSWPPWLRAGTRLQLPIVIIGKASIYAGTTLLLYSWKYWRELNLAVEPKIAIGRILVDLNLAVRYGIAIRIILYVSRKFWQILIWRL